MPRSPRPTTTSTTNHDSHDRHDRHDSSPPRRTTRTQTTPGTAGRATDGTFGTDAGAPPNTPDPITDQADQAADQPEPVSEPLPELLAAVAREQLTADEEAALYDERVWQLRLRGLSYREIVRALASQGQHTTKERVMRAVGRMLKETAPKRREARERWLGQAIARLERLEEAAWEQFDSSGDITCLNTIRGCERDIAQLRGLVGSSAAEVTATAGGGGVSVTVRYVNDWRGKHDAPDEHDEPAGGAGHDV